MIHTSIHTVDNPAEPSELAVAIRIGQYMLHQYGTVDTADVFAYAQAHGGLAESLRILLRALGAAPTAEQQAAPRCPAAHPDDPTPCDGPPVVHIHDSANAGAEGCEHHGAQLLAVIKDGRSVALPHAEPGTASRVFTAAASIRFFASHDGGGR
ncbi:hypothetical protein ABZ656_04255 [Streptomyces sp. NPDC007095]|uniref:hypothetical protein n=1 Tax=Streptomyces sp. NPDC007095 TaxID=3154482 RepID=UPI0033D40C65